jgi:CheY-like chemotaxis protein
LGQNQKILIIEDDALVADLIAVTLKHAGYVTMIASNAEDGLDDFASLGFDVVVTDIFMEGMGGIDGISKIRNLNADVPIIAMSGGYKDLNPTKALAAAKKIGASMVLSKPLSLDDVVDAVETVLQDA